MSDDLTADDVVSSPTSEESTPPGIRGVALLSVVGGVLGFVTSAVLVATPSAVAGPTDTVAGVAGVVVAVGQLVVAYGLWYLRSWAFRWAVVVWGLTALGSLAAIVGGSVTALVTLAVSLGVVAYLNGNRDLFRS